MDRRNDTGNLLFEYFQRISNDGGATWNPSVKIGDVQSPVYLDPGLATCYHGDYDTQVQDPSTVYVQWSDDRAVRGGGGGSARGVCRVRGELGVNVSGARSRAGVT